MDDNESQVKHNLFGFGERNIANAQHFQGLNYLNGLVAPDDNIDINVSNLVFEPGCHNDWHQNRGYQILLVTAGQGWYQKEGKSAKVLNPGDIVVIHEGIKHWYGATSRSWFAHLAITQGPTKWLEKVDEYFYQNLNDSLKEKEAS